MTCYRPKFLADAEQNLIVAKTDYINIRSTLNKVLMLPVTAPTVLKDESRPQGLGPGRGYGRRLETPYRSPGLQERIHQQEKVVTEPGPSSFPSFPSRRGIFIR